MSKQHEEPSEPQAETWLLGGVFQQPKAMAAIAGLLEPADFYSAKNRLVWEAMQSLQKEGKPIDIVTVGGRLKGHSEFQSMFGSNDYLFALMESNISAVSIDYYAVLIREAAQKRELMAACRETIARAGEPLVYAGECLCQAMEKITRIATRSSGEQTEHIAATADKMLQSIQQRKRDNLRGSLGSGFSQLDEITGGFRRGELTIIGARPGVGKTAFALGVAIHAAQVHGHVLMLSLEMTAEQIAARAMSCISKVSVKKTMEARIDMEETRKQGDAVQVLKHVPLWVDYERQRTASQASSAAHAFAAKMPPALVIVDYLQIMDMNTGRKSYENRNIAIGEATRALKVLAGKLNCPVIALSQLNRDMEKHAGKQSTRAPRLSDLRDSGNIEQDADVVILMHRLTHNEEYRNITETDLLIAKNRSGPTGDIKIFFSPQSAMFCEYANTI